MTLRLVPTAIEKDAQEHTAVPAPLSEKLRQSTWARVLAAQMQGERDDGRGPHE
jgi:hypothetical protein